MGTSAGSGALPDDELSVVLAELGDASELDALLAAVGSVDLDALRGDIAAGDLARSLPADKRCPRCGQPVPAGRAALVGGLAASGAGQRGRRATRCGRVARA
jgi:hypothetical protein